MAGYDDSLAQEGQDVLSRALQDAQAYNRSLLDSEAYLTDPFDPEAVLDPTVEPYASLLNVQGDGVMGYVEIPSISVKLPIYHGTTQDVLDKGVGHLQNTSLPVGGESTHAVLTGHTGLAGKRLFTDLSLMKEGDVFFIHVLGDTLAYQVDEIHIVEPDETDYLVIEKGKDRVTLLTCYPYGINTHRLLVQADRIPYDEAVAQQSASDAQTESIWDNEYKKAIITCLLAYIPLTLLAIWFLRRRRKKQEEAAQIEEITQANELGGGSSPD